MLIEWLKTNAPGLLAVLVVAFLIVYHFAKQFFEKTLPSYMEEKGKNLATKQDIEEITRKTEQVQKEFKEAFELFSSDVKFKYDYNYKQYSELYCKLYAFVIQSEYVRKYIELCENKNITFDEAPFLELSPTHRVTTKTEFGSSGTKVKQVTEDIETAISQLNKKRMCDCIIEHGDLASQELLKLAVSYRFAYSNYSGNPENKNSSTEDIANDEEFRMIRSLVITIVKEYNELREMLKLSYDQNELSTGIPHIPNEQLK